MGELFSADSCWYINLTLKIFTQRNKVCERQFIGSQGTLSYHFIIFAEKLGTGQELIILVEGDDGLRQLSEIQLQ